MGVMVREEYGAYAPPIEWKPYVEDLLRVVPPRYLRGLAFVLLTDSESKSRAERRRTTRARGKKVSLKTALGFYCHASADGPAYIVIHVDQIAAYENARRMPLRRHGIRYHLARRMARPMLRRRELAHTLYHEIGHHIHKTQRPEFREPENVAEKYAWEFIRRLMLRRWYFFLAALLAICLYPGHVWTMVRSTHAARRKNNRR
jgi:hypothetical protein